jgi:hypothetical protein
MYAGNATPFPEDDLADYPGGLNNETVLANSRAWCQARSSGKHVQLTCCCIHQLQHDVDAHDKRESSYMCVQSPSQMV